MERIGEQDIVQALREVGIGEGDTLFAHSFLGAFGILEGGAEAVIRAFETVVGPSGTLILPTYTLSFLGGRPYDHERSASEVGQLTECFRKQSGVTRTFQPLYSHAVRGAKVGYYADPTSMNGLGPESLFERLRQDNAQILFFGCPMDAATFIHYVEQSVGAPYRFLKTFKGEITRDGETFTGEIQHYARYLNAGVTNDFSRFERRVREKGVAKTASLGRGELICLRAQDFYQEAVSAFREDTFCFLKEPVDLEALKER
jgi:aminoglycoside 3-N-acetyltransferase